MGAFKDKILDELYKNNYSELYDIINQIDSDVDVANYISAGRGYYPKMMSTKDLEGMPEFRKALYSDLKTGTVDLDKEFGKDWYKHYIDIPSDQIKFVADKQGVSYGTLVQKMGEEATKKIRHDIVNDGTVSGFITRLMLPRSSEAVERGESPSAIDATLDVGQNILYAMPWASATAPVLKGLGTGGKIIQGVAGNAATPLVMETADAAAYGDDNPRGNFSGSDVATESMINASTPWLLRRLLAGTGKLTTGKGAELVNKWEQIGTQRPVREEMGDILKQDMSAGFRKEAANDVTKQLGESASLRRKAASAVYNEAEQKKFNNILNKLDIYYNSKVPGYTLEFTEDELKLMAKDPVLSKYLDIDKGFKNMPSRDQVRTEEEIKNYLTNQFGGQWYEEPSQSPWTRIPMAGPMIDKYLQEQQKEEQEQAIRDSILYDLFMRYGEPRGL